MPNVLYSLTYGMKIGYNINIFITSSLSFYSSFNDHIWGRFTIFIFLDL